MSISINGNGNLGVSLPGGMSRLFEGWSDNPIPFNPCASDIDDDWDDDDDSYDDDDDDDEDDDFPDDDDEDDDFDLDDDAD